MAIQHPKRTRHGSRCRCIRSPVFDFRHRRGIPPALRIRAVPGFGGAVLLSVKNTLSTFRHTRRRRRPADRNAHGCGRRGPSGGKRPSRSMQWRTGKKAVAEATAFDPKSRETFGGDTPSVCRPDPRLNPVSVFRTPLVTEIRRRRPCRTNPLRFDNFSGSQLEAGMEHQSPLWRPSLPLTAGSTVLRPPWEFPSEPPPLE
jgi:hypothetical protein